MDLLFLSIVVFAAVGITAKVIFDTKGVCFPHHNCRTDNEKMVTMATEIRLTDWPSQMHEIPYGRGHLREYWVLLLHIVQKFFKNPITDHANICLALSANAISSILIYVIGANYFNSTTALIISLFYSLSIWPYQVSIYMGHVHLAQMFALCSVYVLQLASVASEFVGVLLIILSGFLTVVSFCSSSASRKYPLLTVVALLFMEREHLWFIGEFPRFGDLLERVPAILVLGMIIGVVRTLIKAKPDLLNKIIQLIFPSGWEEKYLGFVKPFFSLGVFVAFSIMIVIVREVSVYWHYGAYFLGGLIAALHILLPFSNLIENIKRYYVWLHVGVWAVHTNAYPDHIKTFGKQLPKDFRGGGLIWIPIYFSKIIPVVLAAYIVSFLFLVTGLLNGYTPYNSLELVVLIFISLIPTIILEWTKGLQAGKSYLPSFIGLLFFVGVAVDTLLKTGWVNNTTLLVIALIIVATHAIHSLYLYRTDILPSRMAPVNLKHYLNAQKIHEIYTYDNSYNNSFVKALVYSYPEFKIKYISNLNEVQEGFIVIPPTSSKSVNMETEKFAILNGDFTDDPTLNLLYETRGLEDIAMAKFKTYGSSKIFVHESEVTTYRDVFLHQITDYDRWIGHGWVVSAKDVQKILTSHNCDSSVGKPA